MKRILIVDDDKVILGRMVDLVRSLIEELNKGPVEILAASSGSKAYGIIESTFPVDLLITDNAMPNMSGIDLIRLLGDRLEMRKVLLSFGPLEVQNRVKIASAGADEVLLKPVDETRLKEILDRFL
jgi:CheY-like chemotaxis protein